MEWYCLFSYYMKFLQTWNFKLKILCASCGFFSEISPLSLCMLYKLNLYIGTALFHLRKRNPSGKSCNVIQSPSLYIDFSDFWIMNKSVWHFFQHKTPKWIFPLFRRYKLLSSLKDIVIFNWKVVPLIILGELDGFFFSSTFVCLVVDNCSLITINACL